MYNFTSIIYLENETRQGFFDRSAPFRDFDEWMRYEESTRVVCCNQINKKKRRRIYLSIAWLFVLTYQKEFIIRLNIDIIVESFSSSSYTRCPYVSNYMLGRWVCLLFSLISFCCCSLIDIYQNTREKKGNIPPLSLSIVRLYLCVTSIWCSTYTCTYTLAFKGQSKLVYICVYVCVR